MKPPLWQRRAGAGGRAPSLWPVSCRIATANDKARSRVYSKPIFAAFVAPRAAAIMMMSQLLLSELAERGGFQLSRDFIAKDGSVKDATHLQRSSCRFSCSKNLTATRRQHKKGVSWHSRERDDSRTSKRDKVFLVRPKEGSHSRNRSLRPGRPRTTRTPRGRAAPAPNSRRPRRRRPRQRTSP